MSAEQLRLGPGWLHVPQPNPVLAVCRLEPLGGSTAIAALPTRELPSVAFAAQVVLRSGERRTSPAELHLTHNDAQLLVNLTAAVPLEQWHGARLELHAKPG